jgi:hypothetical protein
MSPSALRGPGRWRRRSWPALAAARFAAESVVSTRPSGATNSKPSRSKSARVAAQLRHELGARDRRRHVPVRAELDAAQVGVEQGRALVQRLADDDLHAQLHTDAAVAHLVGAQHELRDVDDDHARPLQQRGPAQALERELDLAHARRRRDAQLRQRRAADHAVGRQPVALLEGLDRLDQRPVVDRRLGRLGRQVADRDQPPRQQRQPGVGLPGLQPRRRAARAGRQRRQRRQRGPCGQLAVARQRLAQPLVLRQVRRRGLRGLAQAVRRQRRLQRGRGIEGRMPRQRVAVADLARRDPALVQVVQVALHRRAQRLVQALDGGHLKWRALPGTGEPLLQRSGRVVLRIQPLAGSIDEQ